MEKVWILLGSGSCKIQGRNDLSAFIRTLLTCILVVIISLRQASAQDTLAQNLKKLSIEELMDIEVTTVSKQPEKLKEVASAIQVITSEDIQNSGAKTIAEALRLAANLQVAQVNSSQWAISARGFNNVLANKLLVLIDGRTVYTPLYAGVFWDVQNVLLEDIDRIEVISGPGGTLWGANAVNGVINIITKSSENTKGLFVEGATGVEVFKIKNELLRTGLPNSGSLRYGGKITDRLFYRVFGTGFKMGTHVDTNGVDVNDEWEMMQAGFRLDWNASPKNKLTLQGNIYDGEPNPDADTLPVIARGDNILMRWNHEASPKCNFQLQGYYDHTWRDFRNNFTEDLKTYDIDWQNGIQLGKHNTVTYGMGIRVMEHVVTNLELFTFEPEEKTLQLYNLFIQDKIMLHKKLFLTIGSKVEYNSYTEFEYQPNIRLAWTSSSRRTIWAAASRAVKTPSRLDRDFHVYLAPGFPYLEGSDSMDSEDVIAYELGWRFQPLNNLSISIATFYNIYDNIRSAEPAPSPAFLNLPITFGNGVEGETYGAELSATTALFRWWNMRGGYTFLKKELRVKDNSNDGNNGNAESYDPEHQFLIQSNFNLPLNMEAGLVFRYIDKLVNSSVAAYSEADVRIACTFKKIELSVVGQNLLNDRHSEFKASTPQREIERSVYGKIAVRL